MIWSWIVKIALWALAGYLASKLMKDGKPQGWLGNIILGLVAGLPAACFSACLGWVPRG